MKGRDEGLKTRIDLLLVSRGVFDSRAKARAAVEAGLVTVNGVLVAKPSEMIADDADLAATPAHPFVGRGALKLDHAISLWRVTVQDRVVVDVGASTGGFTEVCLLRGAAKVYAVDVGRGQLHPKLAADARVVSLEGLDARLLTAAEIPEPVDLVVCDASFIGLAKVLPTALALARPGADLVCLVKPQFEAGPRDVGKGGVVKDEAVRARVLAEVADWLTTQDWTVRDTATSPVTGSDGNVEFLLWATKKAAP